MAFPSSLGAPCAKLQHFDEDCLRNLISARADAAGRVAPAEQNLTFNQISDKLAVLIPAFSVPLALFVCLFSVCVQYGLGSAYPRVLLSGNGCGSVCVCVCRGGRPGGGSAAAADGGALVAFVSSFLPLGFQIDGCFLGPVRWRAKSSPLKRSDTYYCLLNSM